MKNIKITCFVTILIVCIVCCTSQIFAQSEVLKTALQKELNRSMQELKNEEVPPYFISYFVVETINNSLSASFGKKINNSGYRNRNGRHSRLLTVDLRIGSYELDNSHLLRGGYDPGQREALQEDLPLLDNEKVLRNLIWNVTIKALEKAKLKYDKILSNKAVKVAAEDTSNDFSKEKPVKYSEDFRQRYYSQMAAKNATSKDAFVVDTMKWQALLCRLTERFCKYDWLFTGEATFSTELNNKYYINSEGSELSFSEGYYRLSIRAKTKAEDGMSLPLYKTYFSYTPDGFPSENEILQDIDALVNLLDNLRKAPEATAFTGPAILSGEASGVFFHEIFGHRVEGHREKDPMYSQTFKQALGTKVLPDFMNVIFDPTIKTFEGKEISGYYKYDDEGQQAQRVEVVKNGVFNSFLMSRSPIEGFPNSNGHGRRAPGYAPVARQSNLIVTSSLIKTDAELRKMLIEEAKKQGKEYGLFFVNVQGGYTMISRFDPNAFNVTPLVVYKIFVDGRPDELVRGVDLIGTPLTTFSNIMATGNDIGIFNGVCGAESGWVPVSAVSPNLLVSKIEVQKKSKSQTKLPILPAPNNNSDNRQ